MSKSFYRYIEVTDFAEEPRQHGEYSNKPEHIWGKSKKVKITIIDE